MTEDRSQFATAVSFTVAEGREMCQIALTTSEFST